ncbi:MAG: hypothetical protein MUF51_04425 [Vicinamibacteria bacterium]|jgi:formamidopyrimidine-DNA glycosylase|nr:hypothetical protein [Vicinamibacteria bacterium]
MLELPELILILSQLKSELTGAVVVSERLRVAAVLRCLVHGNLSMLLGRRLSDVARHTHFLLLRFESLDLALQIARSARIQVATPGDAEEEGLCFALGLRRADGRECELRFLDAKKTSRAFLITAGDVRAIPGVPTGGLDILSHQFTRERFFSLLKHREGTVQKFLLDPRALDALAPRHAEQAIERAGIAATARCRKLSHEQALALHDAIQSVMNEAVEQAASHAAILVAATRQF